MAVGVCEGLGDGERVTVFVKDGVPVGVAVNDWVGVPVCVIVRVDVAVS